VSWFLYVLGGIFILWCAMGVTLSLRAITRSSAGASIVLHSLEALATVLAAAILLRSWNWMGLLMAMAFNLGAFLFLMLAGRGWAIYLLQRNPEAADVFMKDP